MASGNRGCLIVIVVVAALVVAGLAARSLLRERASEHVVSSINSMEESRHEYERDFAESRGGVYHSGVAIYPRASINTIGLPSGGRTSERYILVSLEIYNKWMDKRPVQYNSWTVSDFESGRASLVDHEGVTLKRVERSDFDLRRIGSTTLEVGASALYDDMVFEFHGNEDIHYLDLSLPASNIEGEGFIEIRIPSSRIRYH